jgi:hypothetical protein
VTAARSFKLPQHARERCFQERVDPRDVLEALAQNHESKRNQTGAFDHFIRIGEVEFRVVATPTRTVLTLHRRVRDENVRRQLRDLSRRTRQMNRMDRRRARR